MSLVLHEAKVPCLEVGMMGDLGHLGMTECRRDCKTTIIKTNAAGIPTIWCDACLASLIQALNEAGMRTVASCCGHGEHPPMIALADGREIFIARSWGEARQLDAVSRPEVRKWLDDEKARAVAEGRWSE